MSEVLRFDLWDKWHNGNSDAQPQDLVIHENTATEIIDAVQEMLDVLDGNYHPTRLQESFAASIPREYYTGSMNEIESEKRDIDKISLC